MEIIKKLKDLFLEEVTLDSSKKEEALDKICESFTQFSQSTNKNLAVLELWFVYSEKESEVSWADKTFIKDLKAKLHEKKIEAIKKIEIKFIISKALNNLLKEDPRLQAISEGELYYKAYADIKEENYLENKNDAINIICGKLSRHSYATDKNLAVLQLWIINPNTDSEVSWADATFQKELKARLHQEMIEAIKNIEVICLKRDEFLKLQEKEPLILQIVKDRIYYKTHAIEKKEETVKKASVAWLVCIGGQENVRNKVIKLEPETKQTWNIGRSEHPTVIDHNDIIINDDCKDISRQQAAIVIDDGNYYVKCKEGGCRNRGGRVTKIIRSNGQQEELMTLSHRALSYLKDGDVIQLSKSVYLRFTYTEPEDLDKPSALQQIDDSF